MKNSLFLTLLVIFILFLSGCASSQSEKNEKGLKSPCIGTLLGLNY